MNGQRNRRRFRSLTVAALFSLLSIIPVSPASAWQVRLRNDLRPGALAVYRLDIDALRTGRRDGYEEQVRFEQSGRITHLVAQTVERGKAQRVWMVILDEPRLVEITRDGHRLDELPDAREMGLPPRGVQLRVTELTDQHAPAFPVGGSAVQRAALLLALDFSRWPNDLVGPDATWESPTDRDELDGIWTHTYTRATGRGSDRLAVGDFRFDGRLAGPLEGAATIETAAGQWRWRVSKRSLESAVANVELTYGDTLPPHSLILHAELDAVKRRYLSDDELDAATGQVNLISDLSARLADPANATAQAQMRGFINDHPDSLWRPIAEDLLARANYDESTLTDLTDAQAQDVMMQLLTRWQKAALAGQTEQLQPLRATFRQLTNANRDVMHTLAKSPDRNVQAVAAFAVAFGEDSSDLQVVTKLCIDDEPRVRAWALYGLYERADDATDPKVVLAALDDSDETVRYRACMAARRCIPERGELREKAFRRLLDMVNGDTGELVREQAAIAIDRIATREDLEDLIDAEAKQDVPPARRIQEATIRRLGGKPKP